ncbi:MAG: N-acetyl-gamma-glutamyl-phosphate reductase [Candidatus Abyssobacteria bacterium SURF_17]|uniref:N-acetyl-gamma-glutamyl-phosphate reductase n=1 Tax=Candidatus Abyssobacteria bacterium SURF_17 TaxID=2093361 RepID=A0A419EW09_9BACT|nr:MAG: N-acetyl-gamma-glutamyl-phosphate reductase [Candidatus Abyssubacteria bacterium SURF_17]
MKKVRVAVVGANGYTGGEMVRLLAGHPSVDISILTSRQFAGKNITEIFPSLRGILDMPLVELDVADTARTCDVAFLAIPHTQAMPIVAGLIREGVKVVDYSADFRLQDPKVYEKWYKAPHTESALLKAAVYGLPELHANAIRTAQLVALPGCYPTGAILALAPAIKNKVIDLKEIVINSMSGVSGAGQTPSPQTHFPEIADNLRPYGVTTHRHIPEIEQELSLIAGEQVNVLFTPHLVPANRGILTTVTASTVSETSSAELVTIYRRFYDGAPFVRVLDQGMYPELRFVRGSNYCDIGLAYDQRTKKILAFSAIDNLCKGAAGQAVQCMNIMFDFPEHTGLRFGGLTP